MPGSTSAPSEEQSKAKVTESPATNGIFVRPVAVAGIFRPADDKPPALPEKRRFSAICGELRPSRGVSSDEFARRRQSFDPKTKEAPFSQALLKKTPRQNTLSDSSRSSKPDLTNGSSHEDISCKESNSQVSAEKSGKNLDLKSELSLTVSNSAISEKQQTTETSDLSKTRKSQNVPNVSAEDSKFDEKLGSKGKNVTNETCILIDKSVKDSNTVKATFKTVTTSKSENKNVVLDATNKLSSSSDNIKQSKKVYGLIKRESKCEITSQKIDHINAFESKSNLISTNVEGEFSTNESIDKINSENVNNTDPSKIKVKVYGLSKSCMKKEIGKEEINKNIQALKSAEFSSVSSTASSNFPTNKVAETIGVNKSLKIQIDHKTSKDKTVKQQSEVTDIKTIQFETNALCKIVDSKAVNQLSESNVIDSGGLSEPCSVISSDGSTKPSDSKITARVNKISEKINEFQKAQSPPKDFRTVRRTSDVIAAKIQNIFSNISTPEKPPPAFTKKFKISDRSSSEKDSVKTAEDKNIITGKLDQTVKQSNEKNTADSNKSEIKMPVESKSVIVEAKNLSKVTAEVVSVTQQEVNTKSFEKGTNNEFKYKEQTTSAADHSSLKKENKLTSESSDVLLCRKVGESAITRGVAAKVPPEKAGSKIEHSENAVPSKTLDKKIVNIGGKMPIKKQDQNSSDGTASLKTTNRDDRKSSDPTAPLKISVENCNKGNILKSESTDTRVNFGGKNQKNASLVNSTSSFIDLKNNHPTTGRNVENSGNAKVGLVKSADVSVDETCIVRKTESVNIYNEIVLHNKELQKDIKNNSDINSKNQVSKIEVAKITPSTTTSIPTVNVLFRTKSSQSTATKEENRKKVIVETCSVSSNALSSSKVSDSKSNTCESVQEALKTVENVQKSLNSVKWSSSHSIVNLKKEELATVTLSNIDSSLDNNNNMPPSVAKITDKCSSVVVNENKVEADLNSEKTEVPTPVILDTDKTKSSGTVALNNINPDSKGSLNTAVLETSSHLKTSKTTVKDTVEVIGALNNNIQDKTFEVDKSFTSDTKSNVVDINDWNKRFQRTDPEPPRVPVRRRTPRESMPPSIPIRSRFGSLKRLDDSPTKFIARSPSQSCIPQRYSYTEMLSKVCSLGVLPFNEPLTPRSCSSSSSQVSELWSELSEEQASATHTSEMLEAETTERMRLEKEMQELQNRCSQVQLKSDKMEMEMMEARVYRTSELNGDLSEDEDAEANSSLYKQKYERAVRDMEIMKRRMQQQHEEEMEQKAMFKKASDKRLAEALEDVEEERQVANQWKRKAQNIGSELQDLRLMLEEQMARNGELEKKQRRFDAELSAAQEEIKKERLLREKLAREKDHAVHEKYSLEQDLQSSKLDLDTLHEKMTQLNRELDELTLSSKGEEEVTQLKRAKQELERKCRDQEEELEELAAQVSMLEQAKLRLEMSLEKVRQEHRREASVREEEIEEIRASFSKKIKNLEAQLETEQDERHQLMKQKHELERRLYEMADQPPPQDPEIERRLRRDLKRTKALLRDAQSMLEHTREGQSGKTLIRQLKNQLEDSEFAKATAVKARQAVEAELHDSQAQLEEATRAKNEAESRCLQLSREKSAIQTQLEEAEEEMAEVMKKYKAAVSQMSIDQKTISEQNQQIADLETEKQMLKDQLSEVSHKFEHLAGQSEDTHKVHRLDGKVRDLESKLELELTTRSRLEHQIARLKEQNERIREECDSLRNKELQAQEGVRRLQRQMRDLREDYSALQQKEAEAYRKQHELEMALENTETDLQVTKNDLRLACQRIQDLQSALEDDLDSGTDVPDDSGSDSDDSFELSVLRNQSVTPTQRCDSAASNYSLASEGFRSRTSSFTRELSAFSRMMMFNRKTSMDFLG